MRAEGKLVAMTLVLIVTVACGQGTTEQADKSTSGTQTSAAAKPGVDATVDGVFIAGVVQNVDVPDDAMEATTIGSGQLMVDTADSEDDVDAEWTDQVDVFGDGTVSDATLLWDDENSVLYVYGTRVFDCLEGEGSAEQDGLTAFYGSGNLVGAPAGSGWYAVDLNAGQCAAADDVLWGCQFDQTGTRTGCGTAVFDDDTGQLTITGVQFAD